MTEKIRALKNFTFFLVFPRLALCTYDSQVKAPFKNWLPDSDISYEIRCILKLLLAIPGEPAVLLYEHKRALNSTVMPWPLRPTPGVVVHIQMRSRFQAIFLFFSC